MSVIIPVFNTEEYLRECLDSVLSQRLSNIEVLCVDDGSTDSSPDILDEYRRQDPRVSVLALTGNQGPGIARNRAIDVARGHYIAFVDSDDLLHEDFLRALYDEAMIDSTDVVMCPIAKFSASGSPERYAACTYDIQIPRELDGYAFTWRDLDNVFALRFASWNKLYRKAFLDAHDVRYSEGVFYEDMVFTFRCLLEAERLRLVRRELYLNRRQRPNATTFEQGDRVYDTLTVLQDLERFLAANDRYRVLDERFSAFRFRAMVGYLHKNDAEHMARYFEELQAVARDSALDDNQYLSDREHEIRATILDSDLQEFLIRELWHVTTQHAKARRQRAQLRDHNERLKARIERSRLLPVEESWRRLYRRKLRPAVRLAARSVRAVKRRLPHPAQSQRCEVTGEGRVLEHRMRAGGSASDRRDRQDASA